MISAENENFSAERIEFNREGEETQDGHVPQTGI